MPQIDTRAEPWVIFIHPTPFLLRAFWGSPGRGVKLGNAESRYCSHQFEPRTCYLSGVCGLSHILALWEILYPFGVELTVTDAQKHPNYTTKVNSNFPHTEVPGFSIFIGIRSPSSGILSHSHLLGWSTLWMAEISGVSLADNSISDSVLTHKTVKMETGAILKWRFTISRRARRRVNFDLFRVASFLTSCLCALHL